MGCGQRGWMGTYRVSFDAVGDAFDDVFDDRLVVAVWLVVAEAHHAPGFELWVPVHFDDAVVELLAIRFHSTQIFIEQGTLLEEKICLLFPFLICHMHDIVELVPDATRPHMQFEYRLGEEVGIFAIRG